jgi:hypothetical protein
MNSSASAPAQLPGAEAETKGNQENEAGEERGANLDAQELALLELRESIAALKTMEGWKDLKWAGNDLKSLKLSGADINAEGIVIALDLSGRGLRGEIPKSISNLKQLQWLELQQNRLAGKLNAQSPHHTMPLLTTAK